jgi:DNA modification methylase
MSFEKVQIGGCTLFNGDCTAILPTLPAASVDCVITDPPYPEIDRDYGRRSEKDWHAMMDVVVAECRRVLKPTGSAVFILQPNQQKIGRTRPWLWEFMAKWCREWNMPQDVWWWNPAALTNSTSIQGGLTRPSLKACVWLGQPDCYRKQDSVLWTESQANQTLRASARCGRTERPSGHSVNEVRISEKAATRGGVTPFNLLPFPNTNSQSSAGASGHGAGTPQTLCDWWLRFICPPGGTVLDPFIGSGTVGLAAVKRGCKAVGIERMPKYFNIAVGRIERAYADQPLLTGGAA